MRKPTGQSANYSLRKNVWRTIRLDWQINMCEGYVIYDLHGKDDYAFWAQMDPSERSKEHLADLGYMLSLSKEERSQAIKRLLAKV